MKNTTINKIKEFSSVPFLIAKILIINKLKKYNEKTFYYGNDKKQKIIIIRPKDIQQKKKIIFFANGGGWKHGGASDFRFVGHFFASFGYTVIISEYRKVPKHTYPIQVEDTAQALKYGIEKCKEMGLYNNSIILVGQSAGAHLVTLIAYSDILNDINFDKTMINGVISISGAINFKECKNDYVNGFINDFTETHENRLKADPFLYINKEVTIPILCVHGAEDPSVEVSNSITFVNKINEFKEGLGNIIIIKKGLHSNLVKLFWKKMPEYISIIEWIDRLEDEHL